MKQVLERMSRAARWLLAIGVLLSSATLSPERAAAQADPDLRELVPFMMLVIDTSGSMERLPACACTTASCEECLPDCTLANVAGIPPVDGAGRERKKNRWAVALEALTGSFQNFQCEQLARTGINGMDYDVGYYLPYFQPWDCNTQLPGTPCAYNSTNTTLSQNNNGIIDSYSNKVRFGLMTFDGFDTYVGAAPLVPAATFDDPQSDSVSGLWSYGGGHTFHYPNCTEDYMIDTGVRSATADQGRLVSLNSCLGPGAPGSPTCPSWCTACPADQISVGQDIQKALLKTRPYGGTPIAASLDDLYEHIKTDLASDQFGSCRRRFALLMTDGYPDDDYRSFGCDCKNETPVNCGTDPDIARMHCPYPTAEVTASSLIHGRPMTTDKPMIEQLFVVGLAIEDNNVLQRLDKIAEAGCGKAEGCDEDHDTHTALFANDLDNLVKNLEKVMRDLGDPISRSVPAFASGTSLLTQRTQYQVNTGFRVGAGVGDPWSGIIERRAFACGASGLEEPDIDRDDPSSNFHVRLNTQTTRTLYSVAPASALDGHVYSGDTGAPCGTGCSLQSLETAATVARLNVPDATKRTEVIDWMYGRTGARATRRLGDVYHSSPVIVGAPQFDTSDEAFNLFRQRPEVSKRPLTLFVGSNDGILHAFSVEDYQGVSALGLRGPFDAGTEMWGFVPPLLLNDVKDNLTRHLYTMDGTPVVENVYFNRAKGENSTGQEYHTVLVTGMREGGNAYIALDVTNPTEPKFLWQFTDVETPPSLPPRNIMGKTFGQPALAQATFIDAKGVQKNGAVAILPGGVGEIGKSGTPGDCDNNVTNPQVKDGTGTGALPFKSKAEQPDTSHTVVDLDHRSDVRCWKDIGRALYFVDVETGELIKKIHKDANGRPIFRSPLVGTPAVFGSDLGTRASRAFITDADGVIWRVDLRADDQGKTTIFDESHNPSDSASPDVGWSVRPFHDIFWDATPSAGELSYEAPLLSVDEDGNVVVIVGTGDNNNFVKPTVKNRVVSLTEKVTVTGSGPPVYKAWVNWEKRVKQSDSTGLVASELVTGTMGLFNGQLFFGTFIAITGTDACDLGKGRIHAVDYLQKDPTDRNDSQPTYGPMKIPVSTLISGTPTQSVINVEAANAVNNFMIMGLGITQRQTCSVIDDSTFDVYNQALPSITNLETPAIYLVAQASGNAGFGTAIQEQANSLLKGVELRLNKQDTTSQVTSWTTSVD